MFDHIEQPTFILSNVYHHHIGEINNIDEADVGVNINMSSADEMSFNVYKERNGEKCKVWDDLISFKYVYVPEHNEYYKMDVLLEEDDSTVKKITLTSAAEYELSNKIIRSLEINTESDISRDEYEDATVFYNPNNPAASLLHRILSIKTPGWSIGHVDESLWNIQRTFSISNQNIYQALTDTIAKEIECLFLFDSVKRQISAYDLDNICLKCNRRGNFTTVCSNPECRNDDPKLIKYGYGKDTNIFISYNNFSEKMTVDGDEGQVKNCFYVTGGDDNINAAIINCNPTGTAYIYKFSESDYDDMPEELKNRLEEYSAYYDEHIDEYQKVVADWYDAINNYYYYNTSMMPRLNGTAWEADTYYTAPDSIVYVKTLPTWCYLQCSQSGRSGKQEFDATSVYDGQVIKDGEGTLEWTVHKNIISLPSARQIVEGGLGTPWKAKKNYNLNDTVYTATLPYNYKMKCTKAGKSGDTEPDTSDATLSKVYVDGTVNWTIVANDIPQDEVPLRTYLGDPNNAIYFLNKLPESKESINNEIVNIASLQFNNIFRMEIVSSSYSTDPVKKEVTKSNVRWQNDKCYVNDVLVTDQYILYSTPAPGYNSVYRYVDKAGKYTGEEYKFYNETFNDSDTVDDSKWQFKKVGGSKLASSFVTIDGNLYHFDTSGNHYMTVDLSGEGADHWHTFTDNNKMYDCVQDINLHYPWQIGLLLKLRDHFKTTQMLPTKEWTRTSTTVEIDTYTWTGNIRVYNTGDKDDTYTTTTPITAHLTTTAAYEDYMKYMQNKIDKRLYKSESTIKSLYGIPIPRDEDGNYLPDSETEFTEILTQYSLDILKDCDKAFQSALEVMQSQGTGDPDKSFYGYDLYTPLYTPYYHRQQLVQAEMAKREKTVEEWEKKRDNYRSKMLEWQDSFDLTKFVGDELYAVFFHYIREGDYNNPNYISDGISDGEVINYAKKVLELADEELNKATKLQLTLSDSLQNLLNTTEFKNYKDKFQIGDWIICEADDEPYKLRLIGVSYNYGNPESITVTFSNTTKVENYLSDAQDILSKAQAMSTSYNATVHQVEKSSAVTNEVESWKEEGMSSEETKIVSNDVEEILYDDNGIIAREYDDVTKTFSPEQLRIQNNKIVFTDDNWKTTALAIGKNEYNYYDDDDVLTKGEGYGVNAKFVVGGIISGSQMIAGKIYSKNYNGTVGNQNGSIIDMDDGSFSFAGGGLTGKKNSDGTYELNYDGNVTGVMDVGEGSEIGDWVVSEHGLQNGNYLVTPTDVRTSDKVRSDKLYADTDIYIDNVSLTTTLSGKQDTLTAGDNITIDENNVISAADGTEVEANPSGSPTATLNKLKVDDVIYGLASGGSYVELTQEEYDDLPDSKYTDDIVYFIKPYEDHEDGSVVCRVYEDGTTVWYFNNFEYYGGEDHYAVPASLEQYLPTPPSSDTYSYMTSSYEVVSGEQSSTQSGWIGFLMNYGGQNFTSVRSWTIPLTSTNNGHFDARLIIGADTQGGTGYRQQITEYIAPEKDTETVEICGNIILNGVQYTNNEESDEVSITPTLSTGTKIADYSIGSTIGALYAPSGGGGGSEYYLTNGLVGSDGGTYVTCPLDETMVNGFYVVIMRDGNTTYSTTLIWTGSTTTVTLGSNFNLQITSTTAGLTYYSGSYRNIYADVIKIAGF